MMHLRHKRSAKQLISLPFPTSSSTLLCDGDPSPEPRFSGESLAPRGVYSPLFTSGLGVMRAPTPSPTLSSFPSPPKHDLSDSVTSQSPRNTTDPPILPAEVLAKPSASSQAATSTSPSKTPARSSLPGKASLSPVKTPQLRRRSSIMDTTPQRLAKSGLDANVERALDSVMRSLRQVAMATPRARESYRDFEQSRWSSSSEESVSSSAPRESEDGGFWRPRKSFESSRSNKSNKSRATTRSRKSRKSEEDIDRTEVPVEVPPVPKVEVPATPGRRQRMMDGLVKRLGLTPRKKRWVMLPEEADASMPPPMPAEPEKPFLSALPPPPPERSVPKKSSLRSLRSALSKKSSTTTLRSMRSAALSHHPFANTGPVMDCNPPPVPSRPTDEVPFCIPVPTTPRGRRTPKTSIGPPRLQPSTSPSKFLQDMPRRAPGTPKDDDGLEDLPVPIPAIPRVRPSMPPRDQMYSDAYSSPGVGSFVSSFTSPRAHSTPGDVSTPQSDSIMTPNASMEVVSPFIHTPPLSARAADSALKPKRLLSLLPRQQRANLGLQTPSATGPGLRKKKSTVDMRVILGTPLQEKSANIVEMPKSGPALAERCSAGVETRDPLGILKKQAGADTLPYRGGAGDGWSTPFPRTRSKQDDYFGASGTTSVRGTSVPGTRVRGTSVPASASGEEGKKRRPSTFGIPAALDFTASPTKRFSTSTTRSARRRQESDVSMETAETAETGESVASVASVASAARTEEWELEGWLREVERVEAKT